MNESGSDNSREKNTGGSSQNIIDRKDDTQEKSGQGVVSDKERLDNYRELLSKIEDALFESRTGATLTASFLANDIKSKIVSISRELRGAYRGKNFKSLHDSSLSKIIDHLDEAVNKLMAAVDAFEDESKSGTDKRLKAREYCTECEKGLREAQILLETC